MSLLQRLLLTCCGPPVPFYLGTTCPQLLGPHLVRRHLVHLVRPHLVRTHLVLVRPHLVRTHMIRAHLVQLKPTDASSQVSSYLKCKLNYIHMDMSWPRANGNVDRLCVQ